MIKNWKLVPLVLMKLEYMFCDDVYRRVKWIE